MSNALKVVAESGDELVDRSVVLLSEQALQAFLRAAIREYESITEEAPRPCFAVLTGRSAGAGLLVEGVEFGRNVRRTNPAADEEFAAAIIPRFGSAYENPVRAWWLDPADLLSISRRAEAAGLEILGSIHLHPDWHRLGPESERDRPLCERPTPMDDYVFSSSGWPVNVVCYLERLQGRFYYTLAAWAPPAAGASGCRSIPLRVRTMIPEQREESR